MSDLAVYASYAEIFSALAIIGGAIFGLVQLHEFRQRRRYNSTVDLCRGFSEPELGKAITLLRDLPEDISGEDFAARGKEYEAAALVLGMTFESIGLLVYMRAASFTVVQQLTGGLLLMIWRRIGNWVIMTRQTHNNPRFGEWVQWLAERIEAEESTMTPAYEAYADWKKD